MAKLHPSGVTPVPLYRLSAKGDVTGPGASEGRFRVPCEVYSPAGGWTVHCETLADFADALRRHAGEPGVQIPDVPALVEYVCGEPLSAAGAAIPRGGHKRSDSAADVYQQWAF